MKAKMLLSAAALTLTLSNVANASASMHNTIFVHNNSLKPLNIKYRIYHGNSFGDFHRGDEKSAVLKAGANEFDIAIKDFSYVGLTVITIGKQTLTADFTDWFRDPMDCAQITSKTLQVGDIIINLNADSKVECTRARGAFPSYNDYY